MNATPRPVFLWRLRDQYGTIINWGVDEGTDVFVEDILASLPSGIDRDLDQMQAYFDEHRPGDGWQFEMVRFDPDLQALLLIADGPVNDSMPDPTAEEEVAILRSEKADRDYRMERLLAGKCLEGGPAAEDEAFSPDRCPACTEEVGEAHRDLCILASIDALMDMWHQFAYTAGDGTRHNGGLSALEYAEHVLRERGLLDE